MFFLFGCFCVAEVSQNGGAERFCHDFRSGPRRCSVEVCRPHAQQLESFGEAVGKLGEAVGKSRATPLRFNPSINKCSRTSSEAVTPNCLSLRLWLCVPCDACLRLQLATCPWGTLTFALWQRGNKQRSPRPEGRIGSERRFTIRSNSQSKTTPHNDNQS